MKNGAHVHILHNPKAGEQDSTRADLIRLVEASGFSCDYASVKENGWHRFKPHTSLLIVVGGDGTVRAVAQKTLKSMHLAKPLPLLLLPAGTANNLAATLGISSQTSDLPSRLSGLRQRPVDVGTISGFGKTSFFLEGAGYGLFPVLMRTMKSDRREFSTREEELEVARKKLYDVAKAHEATYAELMIDGKVYQGKFLLVEILNTQSIGPNLQLAPDADPGDGVFHVAMLRGENREAFLAYLAGANLTNGKMDDNRGKASLPWQLVEMREETHIRSESTLLHVDDKLVECRENSLLRIGIRKGVLDMVL